MKRKLKKGVGDEQFYQYLYHNTIRVKNLHDVLKYSNDDFQMTLWAWFEKFGILIRILFERHDLSETRTESW